MAITAQEAWTDRQGVGQLVVPKFVREIIECVAFEAREERKVDKRSGVSQRMPITCLENVVSSAEQRALAHGESVVVPRTSDIYAAMPSLTGKFELEYEGELRGADTVARDIIRQATARIFMQYFENVPMHTIVQWFEIGGHLKYPAGASTKEVYALLRKIQGLFERTQELGIQAKDDPALLVAGAEFILEGLYALKKISRNEEVGFHAERRPTRSEAPERDAGSPPPRRRPIN